MNHIARGQAIMQQLVKLAGSAAKLRNGDGVTETTKVAPEAVIAALRALAKRDVLVGVPREDADRQDGALNNAARLYLHEHGAPEVNLPARPTVIPGIMNARDQLQLYLAAAMRKAAAGNPQGAELDLHRAGLLAADSIKAMINSNIQPPLAERTLQERRARGVTRTNTLIDYAEMRNAVTYVLRDKS